MEMIPEVLVHVKPPPPPSPLKAHANSHGPITNLVISADSDSRMRQRAAGIIDPCPGEGLGILPTAKGDGNIRDRARRGRTILISTTKEDKHI
ncbi:hypothetical protein N9L68_07455 [bacterium]|nr:hypothetical protein [bacterium]